MEEAGELSLVNMDRPRAPVYPPCTAILSVKENTTMDLLSNGTLMSLLY
jgi:hypothetical protein